MWLFFAFASTCAVFHLAGGALALRMQLGPAAAAPEGPSHEEARVSAGKRPRLSRNTAGAMTNLALAILFTGVLTRWTRVEHTGPMEVTATTAGGPAATAGVHGGDTLRTVAGHDVHTVEDVRAVIGAAPPGPVDVVVERAGTPMRLSVTPIEAETGRRLGVILEQAPVRRAASFPEAAAATFAAVPRFIGMAVAGAVASFSGERTDLAGPVAIVKSVRTDARVGNTVARFYAELLASMCLYAGGVGLLLALYVALRRPAAPGRADTRPPAI